MIKITEQKLVLFPIIIVQAIKVHLHVLFIFLAIAGTAFGWSYDTTEVDENNQSNSVGLYSIYSSEDMHEQLSQLSYDIQRNDSIAAGFDLAALVEHYADNPELPDELMNIAARCSRENKREYAVTLYSQLISSWPQTSQACFALEAMARLYSELGDEEKAHLAIERLKKENKNFSHKAEPFYRLGWYYSESKNMDDYGAELYEYAVNNCPKDDYAMFSQVELIKYVLRKGDFTKGSELYKNLIANYSGKPVLVSKIWTIADVYLQKNDPNSASNIYKDIGTF